MLRSLPFTGVPQLLSYISWNLPLFPHSLTLIFKNTFTNPNSKLKQCYVLCILKYSTHTLILYKYCSFCTNEPSEQSTTLSVENTNPLFMRSKVLELHDIVPLQTAMFMYKARNNLGPHNIQKRFQERGGGYNLRGKSNFEIPKISTAKKWF